MILITLETPRMQPFARNAVSPFIVVQQLQLGSIWVREVPYWTMKALGWTVATF